MKIPVSRRTNRETGEVVVSYVDVDEIQLVNAFIGLFNQEHPDGDIQALEAKHD